MQKMERPSARTAAVEGQDLPLAIDIQHLNGFYGDFQALKDISMPIYAKRITAYIGPSGCGKSTMLRWINRMNDTIPIARAEGQIKLSDGLDVLAKTTDVVDLRRRIGMVFQKPNPFPKSIFQNVAFGANLHLKITKQETEDLVRWSLEKAALWDEVKDRLDDSALGLSGGQQQRLCIARAIAVGPEILLMDEPCSALDPRSTDAIEQLMIELRESYSIVIVTHNMQQAARVSDYSAYFFTGELVEYGTTEQIFQNPRKKETEDYITGRFG